mmetsp:Transcript_9308/g.29050  ORF Transcript_9308/g.29050 Transcript_9308/m.29050 type:complete len:209 (-) Transcript_9308:331-957(-)
MARKSGTHVSTIGCSSLPAPSSALRMTWAILRLFSSSSRSRRAISVSRQRLRHCAAVSKLVRRSRTSLNLVPWKRWARFCRRDSSIRISPRRNMLSRTTRSGLVMARDRHTAKTLATVMMIGPQIASCLLRSVAGWITSSSLTMFTSSTLRPSARGSVTCLAVTTWPSRRCSRGTSAQLQRLLPRGGPWSRQCASISTRATDRTGSCT